MSQAPSPRAAGRRGRPPAALAAAALAAAASAGAPAPDAPPLPGPACVDGFGRFGTTVELSAGGALLAVGAPHDSNASAAAGALHPGDPGFGEAMAGIRRESPSGASDVSYDYEAGEHVIYDRETGETTRPGWRYYSGAVHVFRLGASGRWEPEAYLKAAEPLINGMLGGALAMDAAGDTLAAGPGPYGEEPHEHDIGVGMRGASVFRRSASGRWAPEARLEPRKRGSDDRFGWSLALSGDGAALAAGAKWSGPGGAGGSVLSEPSDFINLRNKGERDAPGAVYVYRRSDSGRWALEAIVEAPAPGAGDEFGEAVALDADGSALAVGAGTEDGSAAGARMAGEAGLAEALADEGAPDSGAAYVFRRSAPGRWAPEAYLKAPAPGRGDRFGDAVALSADGRTLAAGAPRDDSAAAGALHPGDAGFAAALAGEGAEDSGAACVYRRGPSGRWELEAYVKAPAPGRNDRFGQSVSLSAGGGALAAGAPRYDPGDEELVAAMDSSGAEASGAAYVYRRSASGRWALEARVKAPAPGLGDRFGEAVALSADGRTLAAGAPGDDSAASGAFRPGDEGFAEAPGARGARHSGAAYVYRRGPSGRWALGAFAKAPVPGEGDRFGLSVSLGAAGGALAAGAPGEDSAAPGALHPGDEGFAEALAGEGAEDSGAAYLYELRR